MHILIISQVLLCVKAPYSCMSIWNDWQGSKLGDGYIISWKRVHKMIEQRVIFRDTVGI